MLFYYLFGYIESLFLWSILTIGIIYCVFRIVSYRSRTVYATLIPAVFGLLYALMELLHEATYSGVFIYRIPSNVFFLLAVTLSALPGLVAYHRIIKQMGKLYGKWLVYFGFIYVFVIAIVGIIVTCLNATPSAPSKELNEFISRGNYVVIGILVFFNKLYGKKLQEKARITLIMYTFYYMISGVFSSIIHLDIDTPTFDFLVSFMFVFVDIPMILSFAISFFYGHLWTMDKILDDEGDEEDGSGVEYEDDEGDAEADADEESDLDATDTFLQV